MLTWHVADVFTSGQDLGDVATQWLSKYQSDGPEAMTELVNLILKSCGCDLQVDLDDINDPDNASDRLAELQGEHQAVSLEGFRIGNSL